MEDSKVPGMYHNRLLKAESEASSISEPYLDHKNILKPADAFSMSLHQSFRKYQVRIFYYVPLKAQSIHVVKAECCLCVTADCLVTAEW